jgi:hypothetical protein
MVARRFRATIGQPAAGSFRLGVQMPAVAGACPPSAPAGLATFVPIESIVPVSLQVGEGWSGTYAAGLFTVIDGDEHFGGWDFDLSAVAEDLLVHLVPLTQVPGSVLPISHLSELPYFSLTPSSLLVPGGLVEFARLQGGNLRTLEFQTSVFAGPVDPDLSLQFRLYAAKISAS